VNFADSRKRGMGIVSLYILTALNKKPQSGYDLLKDISEKTGGRWIPSKGTLYPLIKHMEENSLVKVNKLGKRSKKIYELTRKGKELLANAHKHHSGTRERLMTFRNLLIEIFGEHVTSYGESLFDIKELVFAINPSKKNQVVKALKKCISDLQKLK